LRQKKSYANRALKSNLTDMKTDRRKFLGTALAGSLGAVLPRTSYSSSAQIHGADALGPKYAKLDQILKQPVFRKEFFHDAVIIESLELLRFKDSFLCRVR